MQTIAQSDGGPVAPEADAEPAPRRVHRPVRSFRAIGVFVLVLGAVAGGYVTISQSAPSIDLSLGLSDVAGPTATSATPTGRPSHDPAHTNAQEKATAAAADAADRAKKADEAKRNVEQQAASRSDPRGSYPVPASCGAYSGNRAVGCAVLLERGFGLDQMSCLDKLFAKESGWNPKARNKSSGAYGIPQALPGNKMATEGADWETNPATQIKWGLTYIKNRYKTPCAAWAHSQATGSY